MAEKFYLCIDLKSFFASVECVDRGLDPFTTNLVVADPSRGNGAICLAITPAMKALGIKNRCRVFEIPKSVEYITALPHMKRYMEVSADIYSVYLDFISPDDIHVYSIDECFIDVTQYLKMYRKTPREIAVMLINAVFKKTGICAAAGIGTNLFLAKVALDITAKHTDDHIGYLDENEFKKTIWTHRPITDIWNIGKGIAKRLEKYGVSDLKGITELPSKLLYKEFGVNAENIINHANGIERCTISDIKNYKPKSSSLSHSQILFEDYKYEDAFLVLKEMVDKQVLELVEKKLVTDSISLYIGYSKDVIHSTGGTRKIGEFTNSYKKLIGHFESLFKETTVRGYPIRKIGIGLNNLEDDSMSSITLFTDIEAEEKERKLQQAIISIKNKHGKNAVLKGISYTEKGTARARNKLIGGHNGE